MVICDAYNCTLSFIRRSTMGQRPRAVECTEMAVVPAAQHLVEKDAVGHRINAPLVGLD